MPKVVLPPFSCTVFPCMLIFTASPNASPRATFVVKKNRKFWPQGSARPQLLQQSSYATTGLRICRRSLGILYCNRTTPGYHCLLTTMPTAPRRACDTAVSSRFLSIGSRPKFVSWCISQPDQIRKPCTLAQKFRTVIGKTGTLTEVRGPKRGSILWTQFWAAFPSPY